MDFSLAVEQTLLVEQLAAFARDELAPGYRARDRAAVFPQALWRRLGALGVFGLRVPAEHGGADVDCVTAGLAMEAIARGDSNICYGMLNACFAGEILGRFASDAVKRRWLPPLAAGEAYVCVGLTEPHCGSDAAALRTRARRDGDDYVLSGEKAGMTGLMAGAAAIIFARTDPDAGARGVSAFLAPLDSAGLSRAPYDDLGARAIGRGSLFLDEVRVPAENLIGPLNGAFSAVMQTFDYTRALIGLQCLGAAQTAIAETVDYVKNRSAFGRPISTNQGVSFPIAEWSAKLEAARWLCLRTLWLRDRGLPHTKEAAMCKLLGPDIAAQAIHACLVLHGHYGYTTDFAIEQRLRDAVGLEIADGTPQIQKLIIAREIFGRAFV